MANEEQVARLLAGVEGWNQWRGEHPGVVPDLSGADLRGSFLRGGDLRGAFLDGADLRGAFLDGADLRSVSLRDAFLRGANFRGANLSRANFSGADIQGAIFSRAELKGVSLTQAIFGYTLVTAVDLRDVQGLDTVLHNGPSSIGIDTLYLSKGQIPEGFLRGCGVPDSMIEYARSLVAAEQPIDYYSCFISYSSKDEALAERLHADLQARGVRCWYAPHDLKIGARIRVGIDEAIRLHDKLLLILSKHSVGSDWVEKEVETAMEQERRQKRTVLFPIRLDTAVMKIDSGWPADVRRGRNIGDFCKWKQHDAYQQAFTRLLRDLQATPDR